MRRTATVGSLTLRRIYLTRLIRRCLQLSPARHPLAVSSRLCEPAESNANHKGLTNLRVRSCWMVPGFCRGEKAEWVSQPGYNAASMPRDCGTVQSRGCWGQLGLQPVLCWRWSPCGPRLHFVGKAAWRVYIWLAAKINRTSSTPTRFSQLYGKICQQLFAALYLHHNAASDCLCRESLWKL